MDKYPDLKLLIIGHARHGKDTVCEILRDEHGLDFQSSSWFCAERVVMPAMKAIHATAMESFGEIPPDYQTVEECYADRGNWRDVWFNAIADYNRDDPARLAKEMVREFPIYCGLRNKRELDAIKAAGIYDLVVWVDASLRLPPEDISSCTVTREDSDYCINNNGDLEALPMEVESMLAFAIEHKEQSRKRRIYIAGPMRGIPEFNFPAFNAAADRFRQDGWEVFNPAEADNDIHGTDISKGNASGCEDTAAKEHGFNLREALHRDTEFICLKADAIAMLPGWEKSAGANAEWALAKALGHELIYL